MLEFALIAPIFFFLVFGIVEFGVLMFDVASTRYAAGEAAKVEAQAGDQQTICSKVPGCVGVFGAGTQCYADCQAISAIHNTAVGSTSLEQVNYIEVQKMQDTGGGNFQPVSPQVMNRYNLDGSSISVSPAVAYPEKSRGVIVGNADYIQVNIHFTYRWLTGMFNSILARPVLDAKFLVRLEPQKFS